MSTTVTNPVDPLSAEEVTCVGNAIKALPQFKAAFDASILASTTDINNVPLQHRAIGVIAEMLLREPNKAFVQEWQSGQPLHRQARALVYLLDTNETYVVITDLAEPGQDPSTCSVASVTLVDTPTFPNNNFDIPPNNDSFAGTKEGEFVPIYWTDKELKQLILDSPAVLERLALHNVSQEDIESDTIFAWPYYTFEPFRNFIGACGGNCPDLIELDAPNHRYMPAVLLNAGIVPGDICIETANWGMVKGIYLILDSTTRTIHRIVEEGKLPKAGEPPIPLPVPDAYKPLKHLRELKPLCMRMPEGPSFHNPDDDIHLVEWDNWSFRWSYQRGGMSLYDIRYKECVQGSEQVNDHKIIYKTSPADTMVVYNTNQPGFAQTYVSADSHNWPVLQRLQPMVKGRDVPSHAVLRPVVTTDYLGNAVVIDDAFAIYETEDDLLWRVNAGVISSLNWPNGGDGAPLTGARARKLVVRTLFSGFYYLFAYTYVFYQDGGMEAFVDLLGQTTNQWVESDTNGTFVPQGQRISKQLVALNHTHSTCFRFDFDIDGVGNTAAERNCYVNENRGQCSKRSTKCCSSDNKSGSKCAFRHRKICPGPPGSSSCFSKQSSNGRVAAASTQSGNSHSANGHGDHGFDTPPTIAEQEPNPCGQMITVRESEFKWESEAARNNNQATNRTWSVHADTTNKLGLPRGYEFFSITPNGGMRSLSRDDSPAHTHYTYLKNDFFVTKYRPDEEYACGEFPVLSNHANSPPGMATYQANNEAIEHSDIVVWYNSMFFHVPHTENYPFINAHRTGVKLVPENMFDFNPSASLEQETVPILNEEEQVIGDCGRPVEFQYAFPNC